MLAQESQHDSSMLIVLALEQARFEYATQEARCRQSETIVFTAALGDFQGRRAPAVTPGTEWEWRGYIEVRAILAPLQNHRARCGCSHCF